MSALRARLQALFGGFGRWYAGHSVRDQRIITGVLVFAAVCLPTVKLTRMLVLL